MAAVDPAESPKRQKSPAEEGDTSGQRSEAEEPRCVSISTDETTAHKTTESPDDEPGADADGIDGGRFASHPEVSVASGAGTDNTGVNSPGELASAEKMSEAAGSEQPPFAWSETEDDGDDDEEEARTHRLGNDKCGMLTLLVYFGCSFSLGANLCCGSHYVTGSAQVG